MATLMLIKHNTQNIRNEFMIFWMPLSFVITTIRHDCPYHKIAYQSLLRIICLVHVEHYRTMANTAMAYLPPTLKRHNRPEPAG